MRTPMSALLDEVSRQHFPHPPATPADVSAFERRMGWKLDSDLRAFYLHCDGAELFEPRPDTHYRILSLSEISRARVAIFGKDEDRLGPLSQYTICDVGDGNYVVLDVSRTEDGRYPLIDADHENWPAPEYCEQIASSFAEFLEKALRSNGRLYYLSS
ncbi:SMI1/KNR4 family protein [Myxococcaceae bacterium GXIMD 01537]